MKTGLLLALCLPLAACSIRADTDEKSGDIKNIHISIGSFGNTRGDGKVATVTRSMTAVKNIEALGAVDVVVKIGSVPGIQIEGDENLLKQVLTEQSGDKLMINAKGSYSTSHPLTVTVTTPAIESLKNTGSGDVKVAGLNGGDLLVDSTGSGDITLSGKLGLLTAHMVGSGDLSGESLVLANAKIEVLGSGDVELGTIDVAAFEATVKGSGSVTANGKAQDIKGYVLGSGSLDLEGLKAATADLSLLGSGDISAYVSQSVKAQATGSGDLVIHGKPAKRELHGENASVSGED